MEEIQHGATQPLNTAQETQRQANEVQEEIPTNQSENNIAPTEETEVRYHHVIGDEWVIDEGVVSDYETRVANRMKEIAKDPERYRMPALKAINRKNLFQGSKGNQHNPR